MKNYTCLFFFFSSSSLNGPLKTIVWNEFFWMKTISLKWNKYKPPFLSFFLDGFLKPSRHHCSALFAQSELPGHLSLLRAVYCTLHSSDWVTAPPYSAGSLHQIYSTSMPQLSPGQICVHRRGQCVVCTVPSAALSIRSVVHWTGCRTNLIRVDCDIQAKWKQSNSLMSSHWRSPSPWLRCQ